ncbi:MAG: Sir2 family NAD-dependent protein deacetylase [Bacillota bacterium]|nr:Sir2 family NAD-dependent protein deacetylase [Bacillota bacterium]
MSSHKLPLVFTGAGISVGSGLPTFATAVWQNQPMRDFLHIDYLNIDPAGFMSLYREALIPWTQATPSQAHKLVAESGYPVVTQNIDELHQLAGSKEVLELHGSIYRFVCPHCQASFDIRRDPELLTNHIPICLRCDESLRPDIVLFGEMVNHWDKAMAMLEQSSRLIVVGTSLTVYPALLLERMARNIGLRVDIVNEDADQNLAEVL